MQHGIDFKRTNIKQKKYPAKLFCLQDTFFGECTRLTAETDAGIRSFRVLPLAASQHCRWQYGFHTIR